MRAITASGEAAARSKSSATGRSRYRIVKPIGTGGMGVVYEAVDTWLQRPVALKLASGADERSASALLREAEAMARAVHPRVCRIHDVIKQEGRLCLVMERLAGMDLQRYLEGRTLSTRQIVDLGLQMAAALEAVHGSGIVHRDIKPANVFVSEGGYVKLIDFGLAIPIGQPRESDPAANSLLGTVSYIAPERILRLPVTPRSDLFSLGAVLYEMATGAKPFTGATPGETIFNVLDRDPRPIHELAPARPAALSRIVMKLLSKRATGRCVSAAALRRELGRVLSGRCRPPAGSSRMTVMTSSPKGNRYASVA